LLMMRSSTAGSIMSAGALYAPELARGEDGQAALDVHHARPRRLVAGDRRRPRIRRLQRRPRGLDLASGKKVWEYEAASPVTSSPAVAKGKVVVATADGQVICFG
jgi:outer membrane protein assembly factor BamB